MSEQQVYDAIVIGAGYAGLGQGAQFVQDGVENFLILEKSDQIGGVWRDNTYPGAACDTQSVIYCYSYFLNIGVSRMYAGGVELLGYLQALAKEFGLEQNIRLNQHVVSTVWIEGESHWKVSTAAGETYFTRVLIPAWGQLGTPSIPNFQGLESFKGKAFHSAQWDHTVDLKGLKVGSIGAAASAVQYVPEVAKVAGQLSVFQRSANYILPRNQKIFSEAELAEFASNPDSYRELRQSIHDEREAGFERTRRATDAAAEGMAAARAHLEEQIQDPALREKFTPDYDFGCKRILRADEFYPAFNRDNVELVTEGIERVTENGIITKDGVEHELDVIIFGTGFKSQAFQGSTDIIGSNGRTLDERWGNAPEAYLGMTVDGFPNLFILYGPNTNLNHHSIVAMLEAQNKYVRQAVEYIRDSENKVLEVSAEKLQQFNVEIQNELQNSAFSSECSSWYKNEDGKVINNWSGTVAEYHHLTETLDVEDFQGVRQSVAAK